MGWEDTRDAGLAGAAAGIASTAGMSGLMLLARRVGLMRELPPLEIADDAVERSSLADHVGHSGRMALGWALHLAFGAASGALYGLLRRRLRPSVPDPWTGLAYALSVWAISYLGWVPAMGFLPSAIDDRPARPATMIAAHVVFGLLLGMLVHRTRPRDAG